MTSKHSTSISQQRRKTLSRQNAALLRMKRRLLKTPSSIFIARKRVREFIAYFADRYGDQLPDDDIGRRGLDIALVHLAESKRSNPDKSVRDFAKQWAPWLDEHEHEEMVDEAFNRCRRRRWNADDAAEVIGLTFSDRTRLGITMIGAIDKKKAARANRRRKIKNQRRARDRRAKGAKPHSQSLAQTKPWEKLGVSRAKWFRLRKVGRLGEIVETNSPPALLAAYGGPETQTRSFPPLQSTTTYGKSAMRGRARKRSAPHVAETRHRVAFAPVIRGAGSCAQLYRTAKSFNPLWLHHPRLSSDTVVTIKLKEARQ
ncbi:hypothetical protein KUL72_24820 [Bradyrhizobium arachidis]|uniref:hypothetical protein n=1 Tax=Bradyrhizobium arachidis TaxID=858423 RepID=UPI002162AD03|nr:hypothetical protein [Bradyrhizobium arachidis]UVO34675.1 hypothetical protein KUL72_24820 [Bradyrhizobium arachidis]